MYDNDTKTEAFRMYERGLPVANIAKTLHISYTTINKWINNKNNIDIKKNCETKKVNKRNLKHSDEIVRKAMKLREDHTVPYISHKLNVKQHTLKSWFRGYSRNDITGLPLPSHLIKDNKKQEQIKSSINVEVKEIIKDKKETEIISKIDVKIKELKQLKKLYLKYIG